MLNLLSRDASENEVGRRLNKGGDAKLSNGGHLRFKNAANSEVRSERKECERELHEHTYVFPTLGREVVALNTA
jgi:hypothetical protein